MERRATFERLAAAAACEIPWKFFSAHTQPSQDLSYLDRDAIVARGRPLHLRELACYSSHYAVWKKMLEDGTDQVLIIEDDVVIDWPFIKILVEENLSSLGIHYLKLFNKNPTRFKRLTCNFHGRWLVDCRGFAYGMQAYMLTQSGARRFLHLCKSVRRPIDDEMDRSWAHGVPNLAVFPFPAFERTTPSTIGAIRYEAPAVPSHLRPWRNAMRLTEKLRRLRQRLTGYGHVNEFRT
jgi:glycosyl transferase family 25